jgi:hypothetical protein
MHAGNPVLDAVNVEAALGQFNLLITLPSAAFSTA